MKIKFHTFGDRSFIGLVFPDLTTYIPMDAIAKLDYEDSFDTETEKGVIPRFRIHYQTGTTHNLYREHATQLNSFLAAY